jgi:hypothetical protein
VSDKLIKRSTEILPVDDFAKRVEEELRKRGEEPAARKVAKECPAAFKFEEDTITRCVLKPGHDGNHQNGMVLWIDRCPSISNEGTQCRYQNQHVGAHVDGEELVWSATIPANVGSDSDVFSIIGEVLRDSTPFQQALANKLKQRAPIMPRVQPKKARQYAIGFGPEVVPAGKTITLTTQLQMMFRGEKIINSGDTDGLYVENIFVGTRMQRPNLGGIPVVVFGSSSFDSEVVMDTAAPGVNIAIIVRNAATDPRTFAATIFGKAIA